MSATAAPVGVIRDAPKAGVLLKPLRREILAHARTPMSAAAIAAAMGRPRQVVNYHVRQLARAGFLRRAGRVKKRGLTEQRYVISAQAFVLAPEMLGALDVTAGAEATTDKASAAYLLMLATRLQRELSESWRQATAAGTPLPLLSLDTEFGFASSAERARFAQALTNAVTRVVAEHTTPADRSCAGQYRLVLGCYPTPNPK
ncbi:MAG TPA: helix-turn-helix domain-containing protein [Vicinamibacterales bacterium]|nr:helix-turn-helix domain-containing protein [Vicinamibacterales bacterium]